MDPDALALLFIGVAVAAFLGIAPVLFWRRK